MNTIRIESEDGDIIEAVDYAVLDVENPDTGEGVSVLILLDENGDNAFFEVIDEETIEPLRDQNLIDMLMQVDLNEVFSK